MEQKPKKKKKINKPTKPNDDDDNNNNSGSAVNAIHSWIRVRIWVYFNIEIIIIFICERWLGRVWDGNGIGAPLADDDDEEGGEAVRWKSWKAVSLQSLYLYLRQIKLWFKIV